MKHWRLPQQNREEARHTAAALLLLGLTACAGDSLPSTRTPAQEFSNPEAELSPGFKIELKHTNFFTLTSPLPSGNSCAGDAKLYFHPFNMRSPAAAIEASSIDPATYTGPDAFAAAVGSESPQAFDEDPLNNDISYRPSFLKNVAVDLTDVSAGSSQNQSLSCSLSGTPSSPPASNCATFDYGAIGGIPTDMGGTLLLAGGINGDNGGGYGASNFKGPGLSCGINSSGLSTECRSDVFALKLDALPASAGGTEAAPGADGATTPISMFTRIVSSDTSSTSTSFTAVAGASAAYNSALKRALVFGGSTLGSTSGYDTDLTQVFDVTTQTWLANAAPVKVLPTTITTIYDAGTGPTGPPGTYTPTVYGISKLPGAKSEFGYASIPNSAAQVASLDGVFDDSATAPSATDPTVEADSTERLYIAAGASTTVGSVASVYRLNPTFGPEVADISAYNGTSPLAVNGNPVSSTDPEAKVLQWPDNSPVTILSHIGPTGSVLFDLPSSTHPVVAAVTGSAFGPSGVPSKTVNFGMAPLVTELTNGALRGVPLIAAGFDYNHSKIGFGYLNATHSQALDQGQIALFAPTGLHSEIGDALGVPTSRDEGYRLVTHDLLKVDTGTSLPWLGGTALVNGNSLLASNYDFLFLGGSKCRGYLSDTSLIASDHCFSSSYDPHRRFQLDATVAGMGAPDTTGLPPNSPPVYAFGYANTTLPLAPDRAGMAVARGQFNGTTVVVAYGGSDNVRGSNTANSLVYVWSDATNWTSTASVASPSPPPVTDASLVYSHVTGKFYLFGGMLSGSTSSSGDTAPRSDLWELTITSFAGAPVVTWRQLNPTCYPNCPSVRKSHRMVEVNYNNLTPQAEPVCTDSENPCSFGLFMEGGSSDQLGLTILGDRWMFDPTANPSSSSSSVGPEGHWQRVDFMPPRRSAALASFSYTIPFSGQLMHRAVLFGGETALANPGKGRTSNYFVPPTLGDTMLFDFQANTWTRAKLLGQGANLNAEWLASASRFDRIQTYQIDRATSPYTLWSKVGPTQTGVSPVLGGSEYMFNPHIRFFSPPPLAGAASVVRTFPQAIGSSGQAVDPLVIPEVFVFGGRKKDGKFAPLSDVWKFCTASPGERPAASANDPDDHAQCDAYDDVANYDSTSPNAELAGRWLYKKPQSSALSAAPVYAAPTDTTPFAGSYLGSATYDPVRDRILLLGGLAPSGATELSTASGTALVGSNHVLEYTPPSRTRPSGALTATSYLESSVNGSWREIANCPRVDGVEPVARFGHSFSYDALNGQVILVGGQRAIDLGGSEYQGQPLTQEVSLGGSVVEIPEVWSARYVENDLPTSDAEYSDIDRSSAVPSPCYLWRKKSVFGNSRYIEAQQPLEGSVTFPAYTFIPSGGYNTGYYSFFDSACAKQGPINTPDTSVNKLLAGGVYIDLDRSRMATRENLVLNLTFIALGPNQQRPDGARFESSEAAQLRVHLIRTGGLSLETLQNTLQPRHLAYSSLETYPEIVQTLAVLAPPASGLRQEQVILPISADVTIDRIRIERYSGSAILIDATVFRTQPATGASP